MLLFSVRKVMPFSDIEIVRGLLSLGDVLLCAVLALLVTWIVLRVAEIIGFFGANARMVGYEERNVNSIINKCYALFPNEVVNFRGKTFTRGMLIKVTTRAEKTFEGKLIGLNSDNIICVLTKSHIAADILDNVADIVAVDCDIEGDI